MDYNYIANLDAQIPEIPTDSILSRTFYQDEQLKAILFGFASGQELSEHTASVPAFIHILEGQAHLILGNDEMVNLDGRGYPISPFPFFYDTTVA